MEKYETVIKFICYCSTAILTKVFGQFNNLFLALLAFSVMDFVTGVIRGRYKEGVSSEKMSVGIMKKVMILFMISLCHIVDAVLGFTPCREIVIVFYLVNEGVSIIENMGEFIPIPKQIIDVFNKLKIKNESEEIK